MFNSDILFFVSKARNAQVTFSENSQMKTNKHIIRSRSDKALKSIPEDYLKGLCVTVHCSELSKSELKKKYF